MSTSDESAARFLALREQREKRETSAPTSVFRVSRTRKPPTRPATDPQWHPDPWGYIRKHSPGAQDAWDCQVGIPIDGFVLAMCAVGPTATEKACWAAKERAVPCQCREFVDGIWRLRP